MARSLGVLTLDLVAKTGNFVDGMSKAERQTKRSTSNMSKQLKTVGVALAAVGAAAVTGAAAGLAVMVSRQRELIDDQAKLAQRLNTTYESISNLDRAGQLAGVSMETISRVGERLSVNLGKALQGVGAQAEAIGRLNLNAAELAALPLDERISKINTALRENVSQAERAAVASDIFGSRNAVWVQMLESGVIEEAARQVEIFGLNLSDVDAAKVEMANDAMSTFGLLSEGIAKQLTVQLAPILTAIGNEFLRVSEEAGGLGNIISDSVNKGIEAIGFLVNAGDLLYRAFRSTADLIIVAYADITAAAADAARIILELASKVPGIDFSDAVASVNEFAQTQDYIGRQARARLEENFTKPLRGTQFKEFAQEALAAEQSAAEITVANRQLASSNDVLAGSTQAAAEAQKKQAEAQKNYANLVKSLRTEEEKRLDTLREQLAALEAVKDITDESAQDVLRRIAGAATEDVPGLSVGTDQKSIDSATKQLEKWYSDQLKMLDQFRAERADLNSVWDAEELAVREQYEKSLTEIQAAEEEVRRQQLQEGYSALLGVVGQFYDGMEGKEAAYTRAAISIGQTLLDDRKRDALLRVWSSTSAAAMGAYEALSFIPFVGPALGAAAAGAVGVAGAAAAAKITGLAHDGIDTIPQDGTWLLERGERVVDSRTNEDLKQYLNRMDGGGVTVNMIEDRSRAGQVDRRQTEAGTEVNVFVSDILGDGPRSRAMQQAFGLSYRGS